MLIADKWEVIDRNLADPTVMGALARNMTQIEVPA